MKSPSNDNSKPIMLNSSVKKNTIKALESYYNESRENAYNRQKDLNKDIEIDVPELIDREESHPQEEGWERDDINDLNDVCLFSPKSYLKAVKHFSKSFKGI